jgi:hypothetical protein
MKFEQVIKYIHECKSLDEIKTLRTLITDKQYELINNIIR